MPITAVGVPAQSRVISRTPDAFASFPAARFGTLKDSAITVRPRCRGQMLKIAHCELNVVLG